MKSWVHYFLIKWGLEVHEFRETFIFDRSRLITNSPSNLQVACKVQNCAVACDFSHRRKRSYHFQDIKLEGAWLPVYSLIQHSFTDISFLFRYYALFINTE